MSKAIDLRTLFPKGANGQREPLPKQEEFLRLALDPDGPNNIAYIGGYGSGKSLILCITMICQGVLYGGEYVIAREFMPELRRTTMRLFRELLPPDLLVEYRAADAEIHIKSAVGSNAIFYFVGLDSPEKLDSLNLSGIGIDEATQTTEEAFLKLKGRLRNSKGLRKTLLVGNPKGHDWVYGYFVKQDMFKDFTDPKGRLITADYQKSKYSLILAPSTENIHLADDYIQNMLSSYSEERIKRDIYGSFDSFQGQVYNEFNRAIHVVKPFQIPEEWTRVIGIDHGFTNPAAWIFGAVDKDENIYIYKEYYESNKLIREICKDVTGIMGSDIRKISGAYIDPSTRAVRSQTGASDFSAYLEHLPKQFPLLLAKNTVGAGIDRVKTYLKLNSKTKKPKLYIFNTCLNLIDEMAQYRYDELAPQFEGRKNEKEAPRKYKDHAVDALRYLIMSRPEPPSQEEELQKKLRQATLEASVQREMHEIRNPQPADPFGDY